MRGLSSKSLLAIVGSTCIIVSSPCTRQVSLTAWTNADKSAGEKSEG